MGPRAAKLPDRQFITHFSLGSLGFEAGNGCEMFVVKLDDQLSIKTYFEIDDDPYNFTST
ncbi:hypothetical protein FPOAC1_005400 [Fusarium poae]|uniref:hypothetical protein n=1 Tax=Fusarium poae TaxID=36050 RepID=UPI001CE7EE13|nr:hypothetical protein FPOAC1_005400 [Fusarium poae]KAG8672139.1 hypothetical protein FPOAC1_005400 [Fusarium poae]